MTLRFFSKYEDCETLVIDNKLYFNDGSNVELREYKEDLTNFESNFDIMKVERLKRVIGAYYEIETLYERKDILTKKEKEYLAGVIKPFRDKVKKITKVKTCYEPYREFISIDIEDNDDMDFPYFEKDEMYKDMKWGKGYKLEELGL